MVPTIAGHFSYLPCYKVAPSDYFFCNVYIVTLSVALNYIIMYVPTQGPSYGDTLCLAQYTIFLLLPVTCLTVLLSTIRNQCVEI